MNCLEFRRQSLVDPDAMGEELLRHRKNCSGCAEFYSDMKNFDKKVASAIKIDVPENLRSEILLRQSFKPDRNHNIFLYYALAASLLIFVTAAFMTAWHHDESNLNELVIAYVEGVHATGYNDSQVDYQLVDQVLHPLGMRLDSEFGPIQVARPCYIRGKAAAHLVMPGTEGPIDIIYMPSEDLEQRIQVTERGNQLILIPCPRGSLAIVGSAGEQLVNVENLLHAASSWL